MLTFLTAATLLSACAGIMPAQQADSPARPVRRELCVLVK